MTQSDLIRYLMSRQAACDEGGYPMPRIAAGVLKELHDPKWPHSYPCWWEAECAVCHEPLLYGTKRNKKGEYIAESIQGRFALEQPDLLVEALCAVHYREARDQEYIQKIQDQCG